MPDRLTELEAAARGLVETRRWEEAAATYTALAGRLAAGGAAAWDAAGECWRRADHPAAAARALDHALELAPGTVARVKLASVWGEVGDLDRAEALCREALPDPLALDTLANLLQARGRPFHAVVARLREAGGGKVRLAAAFRRAQLERTEGRLDDAARTLEDLVRSLDGPGLAAVRAELAEIAALRGDFGLALEVYREAVARHEEAGRRSLAWAAEAGGVRAAVDAGLRPLGSRLDEGLSFSGARGLALLEIDLRIARGMSRAAADPAGAAQDLDAAAARADALGLAMRAGRARLARIAHVPSPRAARESLARRALADLGGNAPWLARARLALAEATAGAEARSLATIAHRALERMGMHADVARAARILSAG